MYYLNLELSCKALARIRAPSSPILLPLEMEYNLCRYIWMFGFNVVSGNLGTTLACLLECVLRVVFVRVGKLPDHHGTTPCRIEIV